jgi:NAD-dependent dihydropyrimidine dehydrogenase PreA subunit
MDTIKVKVNGAETEVPAGSTVLEAARAAGVEIPTLCYMRDINAIGACRMCVTEVKGARGLVAACVYPAAEGMEIITNSQKAFDARKRTLELILSNHRMECLTCVRNQNCELQKLAREYGVERVRFGTPKDMEPQFERTTLHLIRDTSKCVLCRRCVAACGKMQSVSVIGPNDRGFATHIGSAFDRDLSEVACVGCGQCITVSLTGALSRWTTPRRSGRAGVPSHTLWGHGASRSRGRGARCSETHLHQCRARGGLAEAAGFDGVYVVDVSAVIPEWVGAELHRRRRQAARCRAHLRLDRLVPLRALLPNSYQTCQAARAQQMFGALRKTTTQKEGA